MATKLRMVAIANDLLQLVAAKLGTLAIRDTISVAVKRNLPTVVQRLQRAGLTCRPHGLRKGRAIDDVTWAALAEAAKLVPLGQSELARACLELELLEDHESGPITDRVQDK